MRNFASIQNTVIVFSIEKLFKNDFSLVYIDFFKVTN